MVIDGNYVIDMQPSEVIDLALSACEVRADLESADPAAWEAWKSVATKLHELYARALTLEVASATSATTLETVTDEQIRDLHDAIAIADAARVAYESALDAPQDEERYEPVDVAALEAAWTAADLAVEAARRRCVEAMADAAAQSVEVSS